VAATQDYGWLAEGAVFKVLCDRRTPAFASSRQQDGG
jgi:hypothetical protein